MDFKELNAEIKSVMPRVKVPAGRRVDGPARGTGEYRGKRLHWVGYSWSRAYSHHFNGLVYNARLAWGDSYESALANLKAKYK